MENNPFKLIPEHIGLAIRAINARVNDKSKEDVIKSADEVRARRTSVVRGAQGSTSLTQEQVKIREDLGGEMIDVPYKR